MTIEGKYRVNVRVKGPSETDSAQASRERACESRVSHREMVYYGYRGRALGTSTPLSGGPGVDETTGS